MCPNPDQSVLNIDPTGFVSRTCNQYDIQGSWYCFADTYNTAEDNCTQTKVPYSATATPGGGMCLAGTLTTSTSSYVGIGLELNGSGGATPVKSPYNATANNPQIIGFNVTLAGTSGGAEVRIGFTGNNGNVPMYVAPYVSRTLAGTTTFPVLFSQAVVPATFTGVADPGGTVTPSSIFDIQVEIPGGVAATYNLCVTNVTPIFAGGDGGTVSGTCSALMTAGGQNCTPAAVVPAGNYGLQNDESNATGQCVQGIAGGPCAGFTASYTAAFGNAGNSAPSAYPSLVYGWQNGIFYGGYPTAKQLTTIATAQSNWQFTVPGSGTWDVAYDTWFSSSPAPTTANGGLELMVWAAAQGGKNPVGSDTGQSVNFTGGPWEIWTGPITVANLGTWNVISYKRNSASSSTVTPDLAQFFNDALTRNVGLQSTWYLLGIQAGFEVWQQNAGANMVTNTFSVNVTTK